MAHIQRRYRYARQPDRDRGTWLRRQERTQQIPIRTRDQTEIEGLGFVTGAHTTDTDTHANQTEIEGLGFVDRSTHR